MGDYSARDVSATLPISEVFGPTLQGEGPYAGRSASFIRFGGCNLSCSWCDTPYTWDSTRFDLRLEIEAQTVEQIVARLPARAPMVVLTGGEPLLYAGRPAFLQLLRALRLTGTAIHVESNGTRHPPSDVLALLDVVILSPKLSNAGSHRGSQDSSIHEAWLDPLRRPETHLKFVCESANDVEAAVAISDEIGWDRSRVWVMPQAVDVAALQQRWPDIANSAASLGINATSRLQLFAWGNERGH